MEFSPAELMIVNASRALKESQVVFVGVGLPNIACNLARQSHSPHIQLVYESGIYGAHPARLPLSIGDPTLVSDATSTVSMADLFMLFLQRGLVDTALLGGAQIDKFGNLNTTVIGDYNKPKTRLPGSGGACEIAINARNVFIIMRLKRRAFVEKLDFLTSPGHLDGGDARDRLGLPGGGPKMVITDRALFEFDPITKEMTLTNLTPGNSIEDIIEEVGWTLQVAKTVGITAPPTIEELSLIRRELDPQGTYR
ncbi:MAG TPA: CoA-transferase [Patescibacteria group bacterium]|nr:CoA-transferase [Patescibacteria group bacterium]